MTTKYWMITIIFGATVLGFAYWVNPALGAGLTIAFIIAFILMLRSYTVVDLQSIHVLSGNGRVTEKVGGQSYIYLPFVTKRSIVPLQVLEIAIPRIKLLDMNNLPFGVEISCKVQISDARTSVRSLNRTTPNEIRPIVDDTIQSASRAQAMKQTLLKIMRERDEVEQSILTATNDSLSRIGIRVVLFDIKNIVDVPGSTVISDMERVKSAELERMAREAEARENSSAEIVEAQKKAEAEIQRQKAFEQSELARLNQEMMIADKERELKLKRMDIINAEKKRQAEIEAERIEIESAGIANKQRELAQAEADTRLINIKAEAEAIELKAQADSTSLRLKAEAEAEAINLKLQAEAEGTTKLAVALNKFNEKAISVKLAEIQASVQSSAAESIARGIQHNSKLILPSNGMSSFFTEMITGINLLKESGVSIGDLFNGKKKLATQIKEE